MRWLTNLLYKNTGKQVMGALTNCEAYISNQQTKKILTEKIEEDAQKMKNIIEKNIGFAIMDCKFKTQVYYNTRYYPKNNIKYIKQFFREKGYKVKIRFCIDAVGSNRQIIISWKHWD